MKMETGLKTDEDFISACSLQSLMKTVLNEDEDWDEDKDGD